MKKLLSPFSSTLGKKLLMALTGLFLCMFLIIHLIGNLQLFKADSGLAFNSYAHFMTSFPPIKFVSYLLYLSIIIHAVYSLILSLENQRARSIKYAVQSGQANSPWASRNMGILGTVLLIFIVIHMSNFWAPYKWGRVAYTKYETSIHAPGQIAITKLTVSGWSRPYLDYIDIKKGVRVVIAKDLYQIVRFSFKQWWYVLLYVLSMFALSFHLRHGFKSGFESLGWDHRKYTLAVRFVATWVFGTLIPLIFAAMPLYFFFFK